MTELLEGLMPDEVNVGFREIFEIRKVNDNPLRGNLARRDPGLPGLISCTTPFTLPNGTSFVAIGCSEGVWVADSHNPDFMHRVLDLKGVTEFAIIEAFSLFLVLADKVLYCHALEALDPFNTMTRVSQKLTPAVVLFFRVGIWDGHLTIIYRKKAMTSSIFRVLEPLFGNPPSTATDPVVAELGPERTYWFRFEKEFYIPIDCIDLIFLKSTVAVLHPLGFEIVDIHSMHTVTVPNEDVLRSKALVKRAKRSKPLGLFRSSSRDGIILLCYNTFGLFVSRYGDPIVDQTQPQQQPPPPRVIDWHGTVSAVVSAAPYVVLFKARSIEVRCGDTGRLVQVLFGNGMRCVWRGPETFPFQGGVELGDDASTGVANLKSRLQIVINAPHGMGAEEVAQHIYDLVPVSLAVNHGPNHSTL